MITWPQVHYDRMTDGDILEKFEALAEQDEPFHPDYPIVHLTPDSVVRHESAAELRSFLEVLGIRSIFRQGIDASSHVPACSRKSSHESSADVVVRVEREATSHASARSTIDVC